MPSPEIIPVSPGPEEQGQRESLEDSEFGIRRKLVLQTFEELSITPVHKITHSLVIDEEGLYHVIQIKEGKPIHLQLPDIQTAINQQQNILWENLGQLVKINKEETSLPGEIGQMTDLISELTQMANRAQTLPAKRREAFLKREASRLQARVERAQNAHKRAVADLLEQIAITGEEEGLPSKTIEATLAAARRQEETLGILRGTMTRLERLVELRDRWEKILSDAFVTFVRDHQKFKDFSDQIERLQSELNALIPETEAYRKTQQEIEKIEGEKEGLAKWIAEKVTRKNGILEKIRQVKGQPYLKQRVESREIKRLERLPGYIDEGKIKQVDLAITGAAKRLRRVFLERRERISEITGKRVSR